MLSLFKKYFIPHQENEYQPYILRKKATIFFLLIIIFLEIFFLFQTLFIFPKTNFLAQVLPAVVVDLTNKSRQANNLPPLKTNLALELAAKLKAEDMAKKGYFSHISPDGKSPWYFFEKAGYNFSLAGENLAIHFFDSQDLMNSWLESGSHRANILNRNFTEIGIAVARGLYQGKETVFIVQLFGRPATKPIAKIEPKEKEIPLPPAPKEKEVLPPPEMYLEKEPIVPPETIEIQEPKEIITSLKSSWPERIISSPRITIQNLYLFLLSLLFIALLLKIFVQIRIQYFILIFSGFLIIISIILAILVNQYIILSQAKIF